MPGVSTYRAVQICGATSIVARLNAEVVRSLARPDVRQSLLKAGVEAAPMSSEDMGRFVLDEIAKWGKVIKDGNIKTN